MNHEEEYYTSEETIDTPNPHGRFAPIGCTIVINVNSENVRVQRSKPDGKSDKPSFILLQDYLLFRVGDTIEGKFFWGYP